MHCIYSLYTVYMQAYVVYNIQTYIYVYVVYTMHNVNYKLYTIILTIQWTMSIS